MINWRHLFSRSVLQRGLNYYYDGSVENFNIDGASAKAEVQGRECYYVLIKFVDPRRLYMECDCPYAQDGHRCKHMAAVCLEAEDDNFFSTTRVNALFPKESSQPKRSKAEYIKPFAHENNDEYYYFDLNKITESLRFTKSAFDAAKQLIANQKIVMEGFGLHYSYDKDNPGQVANVYGSVVYNGIDHIISTCFNETVITSLVCRVPGNIFNYDRRYDTIFPDKEANEYITAFFLLIEEYIHTNNPGDTTNMAGQSFLDSFKTNMRSLVPVEHSLVNGADVVLEPRIEYNRDHSGDSLQLNFRIGRNKLYIVKNLPELVKIVEQEAVYPLGKKDAIDFKKESFDDSSAGYYKLIKDVVDDDNYTREELKKLYYSTNINTSRNSIPLHGKRLDALFDLAKNQLVEFTDKRSFQNEKSMLKLQDKEPEINLVISPDFNAKGDFRGVRLSGNLPKIISGVDYAYYLDDKHLNRIPLAKAKNILRLYRNTNNGEVDFIFGRQKLNDLYHHVLPELGDSVQILEEQPEVIEKYITPEVKFSFALDYMDPVITCLAMSHYGETNHNLLELVQQQNVQAKRDIAKERQIFDFLMYFFNACDANEGTFVLDGEAEQILRFLESGLPQLMELGDVSSTDAFKRLKLRRKMKLDMGVRIDAGIMNLEINSDDITPEELLDVLYSYKRKKKYYRLKSGEFLKLDEKSIEELMEMLDSLHIPPKDFVKGKMHVPMYRALYLDKMLEQNSNLYAQRDSNFRSLIKEFKAINESDFVVPESLRKTLRNYQVQGYKWLRTLAHYGFGGILADDMGLGKTLQAITLLLAAKEENELGTSLIVCPASLVYNWLEEFNRYAPQLKAEVIVGTQKERALKIADADKYDVLITSYDLLKRDIAEYEGLTFNYQFIDEAQFIKTHTTAAAKSVKTIRAMHKFALTGTPIENRLSELWSIFDYLMPGFLYEYESFKRDLETPIVKGGDEQAANRLKQMVGPFILRRLKQEVLTELPDKIEEVRMVRMDEKQQKLYDGQVVRTLNFVESQSKENLAKSKIQVLAEITRLRQICCDPSLLFEDYTERSAKRELCLETVKTAIEGEHKVLIFSQFTSVLELLEKDLQESGINYFVLTGQTSKEKRLELVRKFNSDDVPVFLISLKAGGTGLNLVGADVVIHYDPWWNVAAQNQATDRAHRIGQEKVVSVYKLIVKGTIEEKILKLQEDKSNLAEEILNSAGAHLITDMSKEELLNLL